MSVIYVHTMHTLHMLSRLISVVVSKMLNGLGICLDTPHLFVRDHLPFRGAKPPRIQEVQVAKPPEVGVSMGGAKPPRIQGSGGGAPRKMGPFVPLGALFYIDTTFGLQHSGKFCIV